MSFLLTVQVQFGVEPTTPDDLDTQIADLTKDRDRLEKKIQRLASSGEETPEVEDLKKDKSRIER